MNSRLLFVLQDQQSCKKFFLSKIFKLPASAVHSGLTDLMRKNISINLLAAGILLLFSLKTFGRNLDWKNNFTLLQHDVRVHPKSVRIRYSLGSTYIFEKNLKEKDPDKQKEYLRQGIAQLDTGLSMLPDYGDAWFSMALGYNFLEDYKDAVPCFEKGFEHTTKAEEHHYVGAGVAYGETGNYKKSFEMLHHVLAENDTSFDALNNIGMFMSRVANYDSSIYYLNKAIAVKPNGAKAFYNMGNTHAYMNNYPAAIEWYRKALAIDPQMSNANTNMGNSYAAMKDYKSAIGAFEQALQIDPSNHEAINNLGVTYLILGDTAKAAKYLPLRKK